MPLKFNPAYLRERPVPTGTGNWRPAWVFVVSLPWYSIKTANRYGRNRG